MITEKKGRTTIYKCGKRFETKEEKAAREKAIKEKEAKAKKANPENTEG